MDCGHVRLGAQGGMVLNPGAQRQNIERHRINWFPPLFFLSSTKIKEMHKNNGIMGNPQN